MSLTMVGQIDKVLNFNLPTVRTKVAAAPSQVSTAAFPLLFVRNARIALDARTMSFDRGALAQLSFEVVILVEAVRQGNQIEDYQKMRRIMDELQVAIELAAADLQLDDYTIYETFESGSPELIYYTVIAEIKSS